MAKKKEKEAKAKEEVAAEEEISNEEMKKRQRLATYGPIQEAKHALSGGRVINPETGKLTYPKCLQKKKAAQ